MDNMSARMVRGSKLRATLVAGLKNVPPQRMVDIIAWPSVVELEMKRSAVEAIVYSMVKSGQIIAVADPDNATHNLYTSIDYDKAKLVGLTVREGKGVKLKEPKPVALSTKPSIQVDLVKSTGRVRLTIDNMIIEVGVI